MQPLRFGLLGTGYWALHAHGTALTTSPHAYLHGVWGRDPAKTDDLADRLGAKGYHDLDDLLRNVDAVSIAVAPDAQPELAIRAARAGCHLVLEKPLALGVAEASAVVAAVEEAGVASLVFFTGRFRPEIESWTRSAADAGPWQSAHLVHYSNIFQPGSPYARSAWRREYGALWDIGPHGLAALIPILGRVVSASRHDGPDGSDVVHLLLSHEGGAASTMSLSLDVSAGMQLVLFGERGPRARPEHSCTMTEVFGNALAELAALVASGQRDHRCGARFGLEVVQVLAAAEDARGRPGTELSYLVTEPRGRGPEPFD